MRHIGKLALGAALAAGMAFAAAAAPCTQQSAAGMNARVDTMREQMNRIEITTDAAEQRKLLELNMKHMREGLRELRKRDDIPDACRLEMMNAMLEIVARHEIAAQERQER